MREGIIHPDLLAHLRRLGHGESIAVVDWANPSYAAAREEEKPLFDFGYAPGLLSARQALEGLAKSIVVEKIYYASEMPGVIGAEATEELLSLVGGAERSPVRHTVLKDFIGRSRLIIRTGAPGNYLNFVVQVGAEKWERGAGQR